MRRENPPHCRKAVAAAALLLKTAGTLLWLGLGAMLPAANGEGPKSLLVEVDSFPERGGWVVDQQFIDVSIEELRRRAESMTAEFPGR